MISRMFKLLAEKNGDFLQQKVLILHQYWKIKALQTIQTFKEFVCKKGDTNFSVLPFIVLVCYSGIPHIIVLWRFLKRFSKKDQQ